MKASEEASIQGGAALRGSFGRGLLLLCLAAAAPVHGAELGPADLTVAEALRRAEAASPELKAALAQEEQARQSLEIIKAQYYPSLFLQGIRGYGLTGSKFSGVTSGAFGLSGVMGSSPATEPGVGLLSRATLWDLNRESALKTARQRLLAVREQNRVARYKLYQATLQAFFGGVRNRSQQEAWQELAKEIDAVAQKVDEFIRTGQHSLVERLLVQDPAIDAAMTRAVFAERYRSALKQLALLTGLDERGLSCPTLSSVTEQYLEAFETDLTNPLVAKAAADAEAARAAISERRSERYPKLQALAGLGPWTKDKKGAYESGVSLTNYSAGLALSLPVFEGFRVSSGIRKDQASFEEKERDLQAAELNVKLSDARFDEVISTSRIKLQYLKEGLSVAKEGLALAKRRYLAFEGPLNEVREALRNLARVQTQINDTTVDLLQALGTRAVFNGARLRR